MSMSTKRPRTAPTAANENAFSTGMKSGLGKKANVAMSKTGSRATSTLKGATGSATGAVRSISATRKPLGDLNPVGGVSKKKTTTTSVATAASLLMSPRSGGGMKAATGYMEVSHNMDTGNYGALGASSSSSSSSSAVITGLPSIAERLCSVFDRASTVRDDFRNGYQMILDKKFTKKPIAASFKDHDAMLKKIHEDCRAALSDAVQRRNEALVTAKQLDEEVKMKFLEATKLESKLKEVAGWKTDAEANVARLQSELADAQAALELAQANEAQANAEIDEANKMLMELEKVILERDEKIAELEALNADADTLNKGLEDDKEELESNVKILKAELDAATAGSRKDIDKAAQQVRTLTTDRDRLSSELVTANKKVAELEKAADMGEVGLAKVRAEREAAITAKMEATAELERIRTALDAKESAMAATMANFNRTAELQFSREKEVSTQISSLTDRLNALSKERDDLRAVETSLKADLREASTRESKLSAELQQATSIGAELKTQLEVSRQEYSRTSQELHEVKSALAKATHEASIMKAALDQELAIVTGKWAEASDKLKAATEAEVEWKSKEALWATEKTTLTTEKTQTEETNATLSKEIETLREAYGASEESKETKLCEANKANVLLKRRVSELKALELRVQEAETREKRLQEALFGSEMDRRALHNTLQELKGNIRVYVRVRPFLPADADPAAARALAGLGDDDDASEFIPDPTSAITVSADGTSLDMAPPPSRSTKDGPSFIKRDTKPTRFAFDQVFGQRSAQEDVFNEVSHLVQSALDGYNVCLFSYGQTGSGKTHTMQGGSGNDAGLIPRSVHKILEQMVQKSAQGWKYSIEASFLEIYNEQIRDLLRVTKGSSSNSTTTTTSSSSSSSNSIGAGGAGRGDVEPTNLIVHQDEKGIIDIPGLTKVPVENTEAVDALMARAARKRAVAVTSMNAVSSRSHSVFSLYIRGEHAAKGVALTGTLNLCDLAGSERLARSQAERDRKKETAAINKSLACLTDVFTALAKKAPHIPFRNSKLTHLLQNCFRGDGKTLMLVNLSPTMASAQESMCSLRFAAQVSQVELGKPKKRMVESTAADGAGGGSSSSAAATAQANAAIAWAARANGGGGGSARPAASSATSSSSAYLANGGELDVEDVEGLDSFDENNDISLASAANTTAGGGYDESGYESIGNVGRSGAGGGDSSVEYAGDNEDEDDDDDDGLEEETDMIGLGGALGAGNKSAAARSNTQQQQQTSSASVGSKRPITAISKPTPSSLTISASKSRPATATAAASTNSSSKNTSSSKAPSSSVGVGPTAPRSAPGFMSALKRK